MTDKPGRVHMIPSQDVGEAIASTICHLAGGRCKLLKRLFKFLSCRFKPMMIGIDQCCQQTASRDTKTTRSLSDTALSWPGNIVTSVPHGRDKTPESESNGGAGDSGDRKASERRKKGRREFTGVGAVKATKSWCCGVCPGKTEDGVES